LWRFSALTSGEPQMSLVYWSGPTCRSASGQHLATSMVHFFSSTTFDGHKVTVIFVLGGPGAGKGTQCARLVEEFGFCHLSSGDLLRAEQQREGSEVGELIRTCIREGNLVPMKVTIKLLETAMENVLKENRAGEGWQDGCGRFLIDGYPREMKQALEFDQTVCPSSVVLYFSTTEEVMLKRLTLRGETSGREDDNVESIKKRFATYNAETMPVINHYRKFGKVAEVDSSGTVEDVHKLASAVVQSALAGEYSNKWWLLRMWVRGVFKISRWSE